MGTHLRNDVLDPTGNTHFMESEFESVAAPWMVDGSASVFTTDLQRTLGQAMKKIMEEYLPQAKVIGSLGMQDNAGRRTPKTIIETTFMPATVPEWNVILADQDALQLRDLVSYVTMHSYTLKFRLA